MTDYEKITLAITFISVLVSIVAVIVAVASNGKAKEANNLSKEANTLSKEANTLSKEANTLTKETVIKAEGANILAAAANNEAKKSNETATQAKTLSEGDIELTINQMITETKREMRTIDIIIAQISCKTQKTKDDEELLKLYLGIHDAALEDNLNAYDEACAKYLDGKVDKERFKRMYKNQIKELVEDNETKDYYSPSHTSRYQATLKVFNEWEFLERDR